MRTWTKSALRNYYLDPLIVFLEVEPRAGRVPIAHAGYYVMPHCEPDCCQARADLGPFPTASAARKWCVKNLAAVD
jgi:hypothetical protein